MEWQILIKLEKLLTKYAEVERFISTKNWLALNLDVCTIINFCVLKFRKVHFPIDTFVHN